MSPSLKSFQTNFSPILNLRKLYRALILPILVWARKVSLPGFKGVSIYHVVKFIYNESMKDDLVTRANSVAFTFFLSLFPTIIFVFTLLPLLPIRFDLLEIVSTYGRRALPDEAFDYLIGIVDSVVSIQRGGLLSFGFILAVFFSSSGMLTLMYGFDKSYDLTFKKRGYIKNRLVAIFLTVIISFLFVLSFVLIVFGDQIFSQVFSRYDIGQMSTYIIQIFRYVIIISLVYISISLIYRYGPSMYKKIPIINIGATIATFLSIISSLLFAYFINNFGRYNELYGSIGALLVLLLWLEINAFVLLIGFELNASIKVNRDIWRFRTKSKIVSTN